MHNSIFKISFLAIATLCLLWGPVGCGEDQGPDPAKPEVVATKIKAAAPKPVKAEKPAVQVQKDGPGPAAAGKPAVAEAPESGTTMAAKKGDDASIQKTMDDIKKDAATGAGSMMYRARLYNPEGKIDPFENPFKKEAPKLAADAQPEPDEPDRIRQTPLEKIDLSQLTLVGIIKFISGYKAIVEEQSGKGYMVKIGTYIGTNYGQVTAIERDRITIQEKVKSILGKYKDQKSQLKLQKPLGEN